MKKLLAFCIMCAVGTALYAQDTRTDNHTVTVTIPEVALLDLESSGSKNFTLAFTAPTEAGEPITAPTPNSSLWLNYSSIVANTNETTRQVMYQITAGTLPAGTRLMIMGMPPVPMISGGQVAFMSTLNPLGVTTAAQRFLEGIGSGYTGNGVGAGHNLLYQLGFSLGPSTYGDLKHDNSSTITVTYTLTDV